MLIVVTAAKTAPDVDLVTSPAPTATAPPHATPTPAPTATPTPVPPTATPAPRSYKGVCYDASYQPVGTIEFTVTSANAVNGAAVVTYHCVSSQSPYSYDQTYKIEFTTWLDASGKSFSYSYESPSTQYARRYSVNGLLHDGAAEGNWSYFFQSYSHEYATSCEGSGTWTAEQR